MKRALVVVAGVVIGGCGGGDKPEKPKPDSPPVELVYVAPAAAGAKRAAPVMAARLRRLSLGNVTVQRNGREIVVVVPTRPAADRARGLIATRGELAFYDWEPSVLGFDCRAHPRNAGGSAAGQPGAGSLSYDEAIGRAQRCHGQAVMAEYGKTPGDPELAQWFVLRGPPVLTSADLLHPDHDVSSASGEPIVVFDFTTRGGRVWERVSRRIAHRGQTAARRGLRSELAFQHLAIVLDDRLLSVPYIDFQQNPDGLDGSNGSQIEGGFTPESAQNLAAALASGPLPVNVQLVEQP